MRKSYKIKINPEAFDQRDIKYLRILGQSKFNLSFNPVIIQSIFTINLMEYL